ncbi:MAG TPA: hypothetical protein VK960_04700 [Acidimicrobiia bacterium]|nr:hypothetical protein [Acidimicrobiia bacterium]
MDAVSSELIEAFVAAYRPYVEGRLEHAGLPGVDEAIDEGRAWLARALGDLLARPYREQHRSPLEVFQEALKHPTEALVAAGSPPAPRDEVAIAALPGDTFGLAPASSQELGEGAWRAHLAWGATKAAALRPSAVAVTRNLLDGSRLLEAAEAAGYRLSTMASVPTDDDHHAVGFVDLEHPDSDLAVRRLAEICGRVVAFGPHVDDQAMIRARSLGADEAVPRSRFFGSLRSWFPDVV